MTNNASTNNASHDDDPLVARCLGGDQDAFRDLVQRHHERVYRVAYALSGDASDAAEIEQETFLKTWRGLRSYRGDASFSTWLTRLTVNAARDHRRRQRMRTLLERPLVEARLLVVRQDRRLEQVEQRDAVSRALSHLAGPIQQTMALHYGADLSVREISAVLGCPEGTVKWRLATGIARLRELLAHDEALSLASRQITYTE